MKFLIFILAAAPFFGCQPNKSASSIQTTDTMQSNLAPDWVAHTNIYEVNVRQYTKEGTFNAFAAHLPRLKDMGVKTLWFMPITPIAQKSKKGTLGSPYAAADYTSINPEFGTLDDFKNLVKRAHDAGFKVIIDWVANHTGWDHRWTREHPDWYEKDSATNDFKIASGMEDIIELDFKNVAMRQAMINAMKFWVTEAGIDGFRADLAFWVEVDFWQQAKAELEKTKPLFWLAELDPLENPKYMQVFNAAYTWTWMQKTKDRYQNNLPLAALDTVLQRYEAAPGIKAWFTTNHDENSWNGTEYEKYGDAAKALAVFSCTWKGVPLVYSGQELPNKKRLEFFEKDAIAWQPVFALHDFYKTLLTLHANHPALSATADVQLVQTPGNTNVLAYLRKEGNRQVLVLLNLSKSPAENISLANNEIKGSYRDVFSGTQIELGKGNLLQIKPWEYLVLEK